MSKTKYYIGPVQDKRLNKVRPNTFDSKYNPIINKGHSVHCVALIKGNFDTYGVGHFCGDYEYHIVKKAYVIALIYTDSTNDLYSKVYNKNENIKHTAELIINKHYRNLQLQSLYCWKAIIAKNDREAIDLFFSERYEEESEWRVDDPRKRFKKRKKK